MTNTQEVQNMETIDFSPTGHNKQFVKHQYSKDDLKPIWDEINDLLEDTSVYPGYQHNLAGNIKEEYMLPEEIKPHVNRLLAPLVKEYSKHNKLPERLTLGNVWVNLQRKHEFNPPHTHDGVLSFVIWLQIPYTFAEEDQVAPGAKAKKPLSGRFTFYIPANDEVKTYHLDSDQSQENTVVLFPASMTHAVNPFYSSDELRITVAANYLDTEKLKNETDA